MQYRFNEEKFINAVLFFAQYSRSNDFSVVNIKDLIRQSDSYHLKGYGRPIVGSVHFRDKRVPGSDAVRKTMTTVNPDMSVFSKSELAIMTMVADCQNSNFEPAPDDAANSVSMEYIEYWNKELKEFAALVARP